MGRSRRNVRRGNRAAKGLRAIRVRRERPAAIRAVPVLTKIARNMENGHPVARSHRAGTGRTGRVETLRQSRLSRAQPRAMRGVGNGPNVHGRSIEPTAHSGSRIFNSVSVRIPRVSARIPMIGRHATTGPIAVRDPGGTSKIFRLCHGHPDQGQNARAGPRGAIATRVLSGTTGQRRRTAQARTGVVTMTGATQGTQGGPSIQADRLTRKEERDANHSPRRSKPL